MLDGHTPKWAGPDQRAGFFFSTCGTADKLFALTESNNRIVIRGWSSVCIRAMGWFHELFLCSRTTLKLLAFCAVFLFLLIFMWTFFPFRVPFTVFLYNYFSNRYIRRLCTCSPTFAQILPFERPVSVV
jgi:hypothetical protein